MFLAAFPIRTPVTATVMLFAIVETHTFELKSTFPNGKSGLRPVGQKRGCERADFGRPWQGHAASSPIARNWKIPRVDGTITVLFSHTEWIRMAKITLEDVEYVAGLAQLDLDDEAKQRLQKEMGDILDYMDKLEELDTNDVQPMMHVLGMTNVFREDVVGESLDQEAVFKNAPDAQDGYFLVPRILDAE